MTDEIGEMLFHTRMSVIRRYLGLWWQTDLHLHCSPMSSWISS